jgi:glycosyltransferase involved in cell wall biosynthesis
MQSPLVSVIIPTYNYAHLIEETLESILQQYFKNWECIIVDNQSTDNTQEIVLKWVNKDDRFKYLKIAHSTTSKTRNVGIKASKGDYIQFIDADDQVSKGKLKNQIELFANSPKASIVYSNAKYYDHGVNNELRFTLDKSNKPWMTEYTGNSWELIPLMLKKNIFVISSPLIKKDLLLKTKGFNEKLNWVEDWEFYFRCFAENCLIVFDNAEDSSSLIRVHPNSLSRNKVMMLEQSLITRNIAFKILNNLKGFPQSKVLINENKKQILFLHKSLASEYEKKSKINRNKHLILFAIKSNDFKLLTKIFFSFFIKLKIEFQD